MAAGKIQMLDATVVAIVGSHEWFDPGYDIGRIQTEITRKVAERPAEALEVGAAAVDHGPCGRSGRIRITPPFFTAVGEVTMISEPVVHRHFCCRQPH